jgi:hypothetical protein
MPVGLALNSVGRCRLYLCGPLVIWRGYLPRRAGELARRNSCDRLSMISQSIGTDEIFRKQ